ncbi:Cytochrome P450 52A13 [Colletotrichum siamense]|uniref:Cytochrome P450 52A13 n=2 Tax=Colletotrichum gloeosporioides species complex TaxID=2707338 RepID=A0A8H4FEZ9_COLGL|nr:Cytochrome P450 52A13 [Colletotrichum siamense]XP_037182641.1 Cytochrome P450 52A13 [Colletotrichum aenigma]XP_045258635.1 Cytochrome P450 52A13 [Colletotrichum gloeosporioides]KAF0331025.1 cytochrome p450 alkane hydroxylase [Colletotrichum asianum]KAF4836648.1 Cytochrome P450 52A13 [Colletotrichum tropicale]KAF4931788.1 Cytochrome P450 52A13 [Colletotrichum viniferum]KAI8153157.1 Cytochrome P450 52A13 [Colletotrichum sp. SAR 10_71]KAI8156699.1 Cytochrome P450 52A13 [Colletotrichum sp. SA
MGLLESLTTANPLHVAGYVFGAYVLLLVFYRVRIEYLIKRSGGVRAPVIASNPVTAIPVFLRIGQYQLRHQLLEGFNSLYNVATKESPNTIEIGFTGKLRFLITKEPEHIKTVLTSKFADFGKGPMFHQVWSPFLGDSIFTTDGKTWQDNRSLIRPMFIKDRVSDLAIFDKWSKAMMARFPASGVTFDIMDLFYRMTLDVTTDFLLGHSVNSLSNPKHHFAHAFNEVQSYQMFYTIMAPFESILPHGKYKRGIRVIEEFVVPFIEEALALPPDELEKLSKSDKDFTFLHNIARFTRDPKIIRDQLIAILLAGRDTTAATLSWTVYELSRYPATFAKLRNEVLSAVGPKKQPTYEDLKNMKYLTNCLNETLRLYPAVPFNVRSALTTTTLPGQNGGPDIAVLEGDSVVYSTLAMQRRRDLYPEVSETFADPAIYSPERWENWTPKPWQYVPFNGGPRICVGQNFAMTEMAYTLVLFLQKYDRLEYRGNWSEQVLKAEIVGAPGHGVPIALREAVDGEMA